LWFMNKLIVEFVASFLIWLMFAGLLILWLVDGKIKKEQVLHALFAVMLAWLVSEMIKVLFPTVRPYLVNGQPPLTLTMPGGSSFPSGHTSEAFALATTIWLHDRKIGWIYLIWALFVGVARILANVHYPIDIWGGAILGIIIAFGFEEAHLFNFVKRFLKK